MWTGEPRANDEGGIEGAKVAFRCGTFQLSSSSKPGAGRRVWYHSCRTARIGPGQRYSRISRKTIYPTSLCQPSKRGKAGGLSPTFCGRRHQDSASHHWCGAQKSQCEGAQREDETQPGSPVIGRPLDAGARRRFSRNDEVALNGTTTQGKTFLC